MRGLRTTGFAAVATSAAAVIIVVLIALASLNNAGIGIGRRPSSVLDAALPQSWALFSYDPHSSVFKLFQREKQGWRQIAPGWTAFAFSRRSRSSEVEAQTLAAHIPSDAWYPCAAADETCAFQDLPVITLRAFSHTFCGQFAFIRTSTADPEARPSADVAKVSLLC